MTLLARLWHIITDGWSSPRRARLLYAVFSAGFVAMAIAGAVKGDALVIALGVLFGAAAAILAVLAPNFAPQIRERDA